MSELQMTAEEIRREYRQAKDKNAQIGILADLNLCTKKEIEHIVLGGSDELPAKRVRKRIDRETTEKIAREYMAGGQTMAEVGDKYGITAPTVAKCIERYKASQTTETDPPKQTPKTPDADLQTLAKPISKTAESATTIGKVLDDLFEAVNKMADESYESCTDYNRVNISKSARSFSCTLEKDGLSISIQKSISEEDEK